MKIALIGCGYVGLTTAACLCELGHSVLCIEKDEEKLNNLKNAIVPIFEPNLDELIKKHIKNANLQFEKFINENINTCEVCFIAVGTPSKENGSPDTSKIDEAIFEIAKNIKKYTLIVIKSTMPIGSSEKYYKFVKEITATPFDIVSNPEFLRQGSAIYDFLNPERIIIGSKSKKAVDIMLEMYKNINIKKENIIITDDKTAEMIKYAANAYLALRVSFINEIANLCEKTGADIEQVTNGLKKDSRIGEKFLQPGLGFGGSCLPKDTSALINLARNHNLELYTVKSAKKANKKQKELFFAKIKNFYKNNLKNKKFALWGLTFKPQTNDLREAPSIYLINNLIKYGAKISAFDPKGMESAKKIFKDKICYSKTMYEALENSDGLIILTEWDEFKNADFDIIKNSLADKVIFDGRNIFINKNLAEFGLKYIYTGKKNEYKN